MRLAVVGAGQFGRRHIATIEAEPQCELAAVADPADRGAGAYADYREMLDSVKPDGVVVATPNTLHVQVALACVERGVPVLVEKPVADTVEAANQLAQAVERSGVPLLVGHHRRHNPLIQEARAIVQGGGIGRLAAVSALWLLQKPDEYFDVAWRREPGGGPLLINAIHDIDDLRYICGEIEEVSALRGKAVRGFAVEDSAAVALRFAGGALGTLAVCDAAAAPWSWELTSGENPAYPQVNQNCYFFAGSSGSLALPSMDHWTYGAKTGWHAPLFRATIEVERADPQVRQLQHFLRVIRGEEAPLISAADAARTLEVVLRIGSALLR